MSNKVTFDGNKRLIKIHDEVNEVEIQTDIYSTWKEWKLASNIKYPEAFTVIGGEPLIGNEFLDVTFFLINGWKIQPHPGVYTLNVIGNIFDVNGENVFVPAEIIDGQINNININTSTSAIVRRIETTVSEPVLTPEQDKLLKEIWQVHGLDKDSTVHISQSGRIVADITQLFSEDSGTIIITRETND